ncbi:MAG: hypothetical protein OXC41_05180 [Gammaproteobacteria bacterium]|nr:hypothetical protein [Gammaproteobacteria bacterium]
MSASYNYAKGVLFCSMPLNHNHVTFKNNRDRQTIANLDTDTDNMRALCNVHPV